MLELRGKKVSDGIKEYVSKELETLTFVPKLAIVRVGENPDDMSYERGATKKLKSFGLDVASYVFPQDISDEDFKKAFKDINEDDEVTGILLLRPLPRTINEKDIENMIDPKKDLDGISPINIAKVFAGDTTGFSPCTAEAVIEVLKAYDIELTGKRVTVVGRSMVVGKPVSMLLLKENATVTMTHTRTVDLKKTCSDAEIVIAAAGRAKMLNSDYCGQDAVMIDVGINVDENGKLCGDVDYATLDGKASAATPVPGGVGTVTTAVLAKHLIQAAKMR
ncbi:bifunctional 5,10-methylenetetrahydrofolate dehydrogenase/5,10-methenyltetrahydrofolate cyclohydrolase [Catenibacterium sp. AM22-15]|uniref:bifunctional 5,10-methylenetetrahydrofolate dehydrogenase/5,10-methenyltetrahydrofolate cyclohydrolase n=1 Tax=unclassified Catenibacterium TaxID=2643636 RepID=UPI000E3EEFAE|nr:MULTISPECIES: bifunctional 5,10-methylenetetrahydrofolate dehydrogenase/5,10-methenyltetrahydrofolate cyclohydrolase [unclassified Catenibacterium]RGE96334.1 bifunctional 5,10-methylenetetrahydrofolate dehydrogenase/5,10-methenyltetrahydrofolate cyclohydrolase [Catenibacterium sp. AM22-6LB]RGF04087.1 bifunctional 5,10-methylenetetrahydrofolate dehydrogenase/5,10-methenyltetrahydrofolate cyclohydrolase [Catenibacterium sp. AM22-15]